MTNSDESGRESLIVDACGVPLSRLGELLAGGDTELTRSLRLLLDDLERSAASISGWASYLDQVPSDGAAGTAG